MIEYIANQFANLTPILWVSQICGYIAFILYGISSLLNKKKFLILSLFFFVFFLLEQLLAGLYGGIITNVISLIRSIILLVYLVKNKGQIPHYLNIIFVSIMWVTTIVSFIVFPGMYSDAFNAFLPTVLATTFTFTQNAKNYMIARIGMLVNEIGFLAYFFVNNLPLSWIRELILLVLILIGIFKEAKNKTLEKKNESKIKES